MMQLRRATSPGARLDVALLMALAGIAFAPIGSAQVTGAALDDNQRTGQETFARSCGVCHLQPAMGATRYGPALNKATLAGSDEAMRVFVQNGAEHMPAFKYYLKPAEIDAVIAYVRTVAAPEKPVPYAMQKGQ